MVRSTMLIGILWLQNMEKFVVAAQKNFKSWLNAEVPSAKTLLKKKMYLWSQQLKLGSCLEQFYPLHKNCPYSKFFWSAFPHIGTKYRDLLCKFPYSIRMPENTDQKNSEYGQFLCSDLCGTNAVKEKQYM